MVDIASQIFSAIDRERIYLIQDHDYNGTVGIDFILNNPSESLGSFEFDGRTKIRVAHLLSDEELIKMCRWVESTYLHLYDLQITISCENIGGMNNGDLHLIKFTFELNKS